MLKIFLWGGAILTLTACGADSSTAADQSQEKPASTSPAKDSTVKLSETAPPKKDITTQKLSEGMYMLLGPGGNIGVSVGEDGVFVIDDKFARFADQIIGQIKGITDAPIRYVINTHYHGDHSGANAQMKAAGATIMAHENVRKRMGMTFENKTFGRTTKAVDESLWPTVTFSEKATLHFNGQTVTAIHTPRAHTDGDSIIYFKEANILHMGDNFFNGLFPYIDIDGGGSLQGMITSHDVALSLIDDATTIIPGHGPLATKADLRKTQEILKDIQNRVQEQITKGATLEEILEQDLLKDLSRYSSFIDTNNMVRIAHRSLTP